MKKIVLGMGSIVAAAVPVASVVACGSDDNNNNNSQTITYQVNKVTGPTDDIPEFKNMLNKFGFQSGATVATPQMQTVMTILSEATLTGYRGNGYRSSDDTHGSDDMFITVKVNPVKGDRFSSQSYIPMSANDPLISGHQTGFGAVLENTGFKEAGFADTDVNKQKMASYIFGSKDGEDITNALKDAGIGFVMYLQTGTGGTTLELWEIVSGKNGIPLMKYSPEVTISSGLGKA